MLHSHLKSPGIFWQRPLTQMSEKVHSSMSVKESDKEGASCEWLADHGIMVENWQPALGSEGHSPLLKNDSSRAKNNARHTQTDIHTHTLSELQPRLWNCALPHHYTLHKSLLSSSDWADGGRTGQVISGCLTQQCNEVGLLIELNPAVHYCCTAHSSATNYKCVHTQLYSSWHLSSHEILQQVDVLFIYE